MGRSAVTAVENMKETNTEIQIENTKDDYVVKKDKKLNVVALIFCLIISLSIWLYVMNTENSQYERTFAEIPVLIEGDIDLYKTQDMSIISGYNSLVNVTVKGNKSVIDNLTTADFLAYASVEDLDIAGRHSVIVSVEPIKDVSFTNISGITIYIDKNVTAELDIDIDARYSIANFYNFEPTTNTKTISITGPQKVIDTVKHAIVRYDLGTVITSLKFKSTVELYDENFKLIENPYITKGVNEIEVIVDVTTETSIPIEADFTADDTETYNYTIKFTPSTLKIFGDPIFVEKVVSLKISLGNITGITSGQLEISKIVIPDNVILQDGQGEMIGYTVEKTQKTPTTQQ